MERQGIDRDGRGGRLADGVALVFGQQAAPQLVRQLVEVGDESGLPVSGRPFYEKEAADDGADDADGGGSHAQAGGVFPAQVLECGADRGRRPVSAIETGREHDAERVVQVGPDQLEHEQAEQARQSPLHEHADLRVGPDRADPPGDLLHRDVGRGEGQRAEDEGDQDGGIGADGVRQRDPTQPVRAEQESQEPGDQARRNEQLLDPFHLDADDLADQHEYEDKAQVRKERPRRELR